MSIEKSAPPSEDPRWKVIQTRMRNYGFKPHALIEVLHAAQEQFGYLNEESLGYIASALHVPRSRVYGVATFYHLFTLKPPARHRCVVCTGTACHIKGAERILNAIYESGLLERHDATGASPISLETTRCVGFCSPAPVVLFDDQTLSDQSPESVVEQLKDWSHHVA